MTEPHDAQQPTDDASFSASPDELNDLNDVDVRPEDADKVKGGEAEDPCAGGRLRKKAL